MRHVRRCFVLAMWRHLYQYADYYMRYHQQWNIKLPNVTLRYTVRGAMLWRNYNQELLSTAQQPLVGQAVPIVEASRSHSVTPHPLGLLWTSDRPVTNTYTWQHTTITTESMPLEGFEPAIPTSERPQTHTLDSAATGIGIIRHKVM